MCTACWQRNPDRPFLQADNLIARLDQAPTWLGDFVAYLVARHCVGRCCNMITRLGRLLTDGGPTHPQALLERSRQPGRSVGTLARALEDYLVPRGLALPLDQAERLAAGRRQRRLDAIPAALRPAAAEFVVWSLHNRERARAAGTRPRADHTIERHLEVIRDFAVFLTGQRGLADWAAVNVADVEAFLATHPIARRARLTALRRFFGRARSQRTLLVDPTKGLTAREPRGFRGTTLTLPEQRALFRRWTAAEDPSSSTAAHPHEALIGLLALLHAASCQELRALTINDIDHAARAVHFAGRPHSTPLDPASWTALQRCLAHRDRQHTANPHVLVTRGTKATATAASPAYLTHALDPVAVAPRTLRCTRLLHLAADLDPKLVAAAFGMRPEGVLHYLADTVDLERLPDPQPPPTARTR